VLLLSAVASARLAPETCTIANAEGLVGHARAMDVRRGRA
jgi:histidinol dehydrogenase